MHLLGQHVLLYFTGNFIQLSISSRKISSRIFQSCKTANDSPNQDRAHYSSLEYLPAYEETKSFHESAN